MTLHTRKRTLEPGAGVISEKELGQKFSTFEVNLIDHYKGTVKCPECEGAVYCKGGAGNPNVFGVAAKRIKCKNNSCAKTFSIINFFTAINMPQVVVEYEKFKNDCLTTLQQIKAGKEGKKKQQSSLKNFFTADQAKSAEDQIMKGAPTADHNGDEGREETEDVIMEDSIEKKKDQEETEVPAEGEVETEDTDENVNLLMEMSDKDIIAALLEANKKKDSTIKLLQQEMQQLKAQMKLLMQKNTAQVKAATVDSTKKVIETPKKVQKEKQQKKTDEVIVVEGPETWVGVAVKNAPPTKVKGTSVPASAPTTKEKKTAEDEKKAKAKEAKKFRNKGARLFREVGEPLRFLRYHVHLTDKRPLRLAKSGKDKTRILRAMCKELDINKHVYAISLIGTSIAELYVREDESGWVDDRLAEKNLTFMEEPDVLAASPFARTENVEGIVAKRLAHLYLTVRLLNLKECILRGLPEAMKTEILKIVDEKLNAATAKTTSTITKEATTEVVEKEGEEILQEAMGEATGKTGMEGVIIEEHPNQQC